MATLPSAEFLALQRAVAGRYSLERELGRGGMGIVFLARDVALDRPVAIKLLPPALGALPELRERFLREARTAAKLSHPHIVPIHLVEERDDLVYFVMAYVDGESLGERIRQRGPLPPSQVGRLLQEVAWALGHAHQLGVIHRDIKPDNIMLEAGSLRAIVTDFGIARVAEAGTTSGRGEVVGTAHYMSPEQATGDAVDGRSDLYSLGVTGFYALTGRLPFEAQNLPALIHQHVTAPAPRVATLAPTTPPWLAEAVDRCLAKQPDQRFRSAEELAAAAGAGVVARREVAPEVRALLRYMRDAGIVSGAALLIGLVLMAPGEAILNMLFDARLQDFWLPILLGAFVLLRFPAGLISLARRGIKRGLGFAEVRAALLEEGKLLVEEADLAGLEKARARREKAETALRRGGPLCLAASALSLAVYFFPALLPGTPLYHRVDALLFGIATLLGGLLFIGAGPTVTASSPLSALSLAQRLLAGRFGRLLYRVAGIGLGRPEAPAPVGSQHTEVVLAAAADGIFAALPKDVRARAAAVPAVIARLEADAQALRLREAALSRAIAAAAPEAAPRSDLADQRRQAADALAAARMQVRGRLEQAVAALEAIRLDLLRLQAGAGSAEELTADLAAAEAINRAVSAELSARAEGDGVEGDR